MSNAWSLNIRILDPSANPVDMAAIAITFGPIPIRDIAALTGPNGQVSISVPCAGEYGVTVNAEGFPVVQERIEAVTDDSVVDVSLEM